MDVIIPTFQVFRDFLQSDWHVKVKKKLDI